MNFGGDPRTNRYFIHPRLAMVEIVEGGGVVNRYYTTGEDNDSVTKKKAKETNMVEITLKTIGPSPPSRIILPSSITVRDLRKFIAEKKHLPIENVRLVLHGKMLEDCGEDDMLIKLKNNDSLIVAVKPKAPAKHLQDGCEDDDDLKFQLPQSTNPWKRKLYFFLHNKLKFPDILLAGPFSLSGKQWAVIILWFILAPVANRWHIGPLYILGTGFAIIFLNLGRRQAGELRGIGHSKFHSYVGVLLRCLFNLQ